jgi:hypothetical protein
MPGVFSNFGAPAIDDQAVNRVMAMEILRNTVQRAQQVNGKGVTERFSTDVEAFEIRVIRQKPITSDVRNIGGVNGVTTDNTAFFNADTNEEATSAFYGVRLNFIYDAGYDVSTTSESMFKPSILDDAVFRMGQHLSKNLNASTMAEQLAKALNLAQSQTDGAVNKTNVKDLDITAVDGSILNSMLDAYAVLDDGDVDNGQDTFDYEGRIALVRPALKRGLAKGVQGTLQVGNYLAQKMLSVGGVDPETTPNNILDGYFGDIDSTQHLMTATAVWTLAEKYLIDSVTGVPVAAGTLDDIQGMLTHRDGTLRALAFSKGIKVIDNPRGQGKRLQPLYRWGHETIFPKSIVLVGDATAIATLVDTTLVNPVVSVAPGSQV